jgi:hypothetical protein
MRHRAFLPALLVLLAPALAQVESLPAPVVNPNSFEIASNSRYSTHSGFTSDLSDTVLSNILWAMSRLPVFGAWREFYVATPENVYVYDPAGHVLTVHLADDYRFSSNSAFEIGVSTETDEEAGLAIQAGLLAGVAFWSGSGCTNAGCPMAFAANHANSNWDPTYTINMVDVFGRRTGTGLTDSCVALSSDSTLPTPHTTSADTFEVLVADLKMDSLFRSEMPTLEEISQVLWSGYGTTPHRPIGKQGLTVPSAVAYYYLTQRIYLVLDTAVFRYHNRLPPGNNLSTSDHRLELVTSGDRRTQLRAACERLPAAAPVYIVLTVGDTTDSWQTMEPGFVAFQYLAQARAMGLGGHITLDLTTAERSAIQTALGLPAPDFPVIAFSTGQYRTAIEEPPRTSRAGLEVHAVHGLPARIEYWLPQSGLVEIELRDLAGRTVRTWTENRSEPGMHTATWNGTDTNGRPVPAGVYLCEVSCHGVTARSRVTVTR